MPRFIFELATSEDNKELLEMLENGAFQGNIALLYTRRPDPYISLQKEGEQVDIVVCRDTVKEKIVGFGVCALRKLFVNGKAEQVGYLFGLRIRQEYRRKFPLLHQGFEYLHALHHEHNISFYLTTILADNLYAKKLLEKRRPFMPICVPYGTYDVYALKVPRVSARARDRRKQGLLPYVLRPAQKIDTPALMRFLTEHGNKAQFFPVITAKDLQEGRISGITATDFSLLCDEYNEILAAGVLWDQTAYKQYLVQGYAGSLKCLYPFSRLFPSFGFPALPAPGKMLNFFTLSFWAVKDNNPDLFNRFLDAIPAGASTYPFFLIGVHETHPLKTVLQQRPHIKYTSTLYLVSWDEQRECIDRLDQQRWLYLECGML